MRYILFVGLFLVLACNTPKKLNKIMNKLPEASAKECAVRFPIKETTDTVTVLDTTLIKAYEMEFGYLYSIIDSLVGSKVDDSTKREIVTIFQEKKVPVIKYKYITRTQESTAKCKVLLDSMYKIESDLGAYIDGLEAEKKHFSEVLKKAEKDRDRYKESRNLLYWWILALLLIVFRKPIALLITKR